MQSPQHQTKETIVVIGAGLAGAISAIYLAKAGYMVALIERKPRCLMVSSKIPVHLHSGGLYTSDEVAIHCLHDSINFKKVLPFAVTERPTAFAVMTLDDKKIRSSGMTQLMEEAYKLYVKNNEPSQIVSQQEWHSIPEKEKNGYKDMAQENQVAKWEEMKKKFGMLENAYQKEIEAQPDKKVFGEPGMYYSAYEKSHFSRLKSNAANLEADPALDDKEAWIQQLARVSDPEQIVGVIMSSEVGLNMMIGAAGIENEIEKLKDERKVLVLTDTTVTKVSRNPDNEYMIDVFIQSADNIEKIQASQVVNATGYQGKEIDMQMDVYNDWSVDIKGAGIIELTGNTFDHLPEVFFTEGTGMSHLSRFNSTMAGINYCDPDVEATYIKDGKIEYKSDEKLDSKNKLVYLEKEILDKSITDPSLLKRTQCDIDHVARFMPDLPKCAIPRAYVAGALGLLGGLDSRTSKEVYHSANGYHAINLAKGGGAVSTAMSLIDAVESCSISRNLRENRHFPQGSHSEIPDDFKLTGESDKHKLDSSAEQRAVELSGNNKLGHTYKK